MRRTVAVNVCRTAKPVGKLIREEEGEGGEAQLTVQHQVRDEGRGSAVPQPVNFKTFAEFEEFIRGRCWYFNKEIDWLRDIVKGKGLHHGTGKSRGKDRSNQRGSDKGYARFPAAEGSQNRSGPSGASSQAARGVQAHTTGADSASTE